MAAASPEKVKEQIKGDEADKQVGRTAHFCDRQELLLVPPAVPWQIIDHQGVQQQQQQQLAFLSLIVMLICAIVAVIKVLHCLQEGSMQLAVHAKV
jgi:hypothetical protein